MRQLHGRYNVEVPCQTSSLRPSKKHALNRADENLAWIKTASITTARKAPFNDKQISAQILKAYYTIVNIN